MREDCGCLRQNEKEREQSEKRGEPASQRGDILREKEWWGIKG